MADESTLNIENDESTLKFEDIDSYDVGTLHIMLDSTLNILITLIPKGYSDREILAVLATILATKDKMYIAYKKRIEMRSSMK